MELKADVRREDGVIVVVPHEEFDYKHQFKDQVTTEFSSSPAPVVVDLSSTGFIDSAGLGNLVSILRRVREYNCKLVLVKAQDKAVNKVFRTTALDQMFTMVDTIEEAKAQVAS